MRTNHVYVIAGLGALLALGIATAIFLKPTLSQASSQSATAIERPPLKELSPLPEPFSIKVNGNSEPAIITAKRGETIQIDVLITPLIPGISGNVYVQSVKPECGTTVLQIGCIPQGIAASISENSISTAKHLIVTVTVADDMPLGTYGYEVTGDTMLNLPDRATPVRVGNIHAFGIQVI